MANAHEIELFISDDGELKVHIKGFKGAGCQKIVEAIAKNIGPKQETELTSEYYEKPQTTEATNTHIRKK